MDWIDVVTQNLEYGIAGLTIFLILRYLTTITKYAIDKVAVILEKWRETLDRVTDVTERLAAASEKNTERQDAQITTLQTLAENTDNLAAHLLKIANEERNLKAGLQQVDEKFEGHTTSVETAFEDFRDRHVRLLELVVQIRDSLTTLPEAIMALAAIRFDQAEMSRGELKNALEEMKNQFTSVILTIHTIEQRLTPAVPTTVSKTEVAAGASSSSSANPAIS